MSWAYTAKNTFRRQRRRLYRMPKKRKYGLAILLGVLMISFLAFDFGKDYQAAKLGYPHPTASISTSALYADIAKKEAIGKLLLYANNQSFFLGSLAGKTGDYRVPGLIPSMNMIHWRQITLDHQIHILGGWAASVQDPLPGRTAAFVGQAVQIGSSLLLFAFYGIFLGMMFRQNNMLKMTNRFHTVTDDTQVRFVDVAGMDSVKDEVSEIVDYLRDPRAFQRVGARAPKGVLLYGPPGNGKTLLAKAVAGECGVPFIEQNGGNVMGKFLGESADGIKKLFKQAREFAQEYGGCIVFIDEIDAIASARNGPTVTHDEKINALNTMLAEMDGFGDNTGLVVIGATNRLENLDPAILRPGRFDRKILVPLPGKQARVQILYIYLHKIPLSPDVQPERLAQMSPNFSGADLANWVNEAAVHAARRQSTVVTPQDFLQARDVILAGPHNKGIELKPEEESAIAWHEAGHAEVRHATGGQVDRVSILPRGQALGITFSVPTDTSLHTYEHVQQELMVLLGGRAAEELFVGQISSGAANDLERASAIAFDAVTRLGLGDRGLFVPQTESGKHEAEASAARLIADCYEQTKDLLAKHKDRVQRLHDLLVETKEVDYSEISV